MRAKPYRSNPHESAHLAMSTVMQVLGPFGKPLPLRSVRAKRNSEDRMLTVTEQARLLLGLRLNRNPRRVISSVRA